MYFIITRAKNTVCYTDNFLNRGLLNEGSTVLNILNFVRIAVGSFVCHRWCWLCWSWLLRLEASYPEP